MIPLALDDATISKLLYRQHRFSGMPDLPSLGSLFQEILRLSSRFVPTTSGSVLIDDPVLKAKYPGEADRHELVFVACFGAVAKELLGRRIRADRGIVGHTYRSGKPYLASSTTADPHFDPSFDEQLRFETGSIISVPIHLGRSACGVLQLINHRDRDSFIEEELELLNLFAGFISTSLQNVLDANRAQELAKRDDLTGLYNFNQRLTREIERADRDALELCLIFLDLDHFKEVNDRHGHLVGSQTLTLVGRLLAEVVPPAEGTVARYGGDEFVLIVPSADLERGLAIAEDIRNRIETTVFEIDRGVDRSATLEIAGRITASIGVASYRAVDFTHVTAPSPGDRLIRSADEAMYRAKALGKNRVCDHARDSETS